MATARTQAWRSPRTLHEAFTDSFDAPAGIDPTLTQSLPPPSTKGTYGFGTASARLNNIVYPSHLAYGMTNSTVVELGPPPAPYEPVPNLSGVAPSLQLPGYASRFSLEPGRAYGKTVEREAPPAADGTPMYWVQPKDVQTPFDSHEPPDIAAAPMPPGAAPRSKQHEPTGGIMTPAERREALVFQKCHERAAQTLRKATHDACRLTLAMQRQHPHGVRGVEPSEAADSIVYQALRDTRNAKEAYQRAHAEARLEFLKARRATPAEHPMRTHDATGPGPSLFQRKGRVAGRNSSVLSDTHYSFRPSSTATGSTAYRSNQERLVDERAAQPARTQQLIDVDAGGRRYNIISGTSRPVEPSLRGPSGAHDRRAHPSNLAMPTRAGTAPSLVGPTPDAHQMSWKPLSPTKGKSRAYLL